MRRGRLGFWLRFAVCVLKPTLTVMTRRDWRGAEHVPRTGGVILAANHVSYADPFTMAHFVYDAGRLPRFLAKESLFGLPFAGRVLRGAGQIPVRRGAADASAALAAARAALARGECVVIYPEGTVTRDPERWPMLARTGVARLALEAGVPVVPVAQWGAQEVWDKYAGHLSLRPRRLVHYLAGPAVDLSPYDNRPMTAALLREATDVIMRAVRDQLGEIRGESAPDRFLEPPQRAREPLTRRPA